MHRRRRPLCTGGGARRAPAATGGAGIAAALAGVGDDDLVRSPGGGMRVADWLPTRTFELVVHGQDIADAAGVAFAAPAAAVADAAAQAARTAIATGRAPVLLRALTGRGRLPHDFTVL